VLDGVHNPVEGGGAEVFGLEPDEPCGAVQALGQRFGDGARAATEIFRSRFGGLGQGRNLLPSVLPAA
jgi:hypothetical protein